MNDISQASKIYAATQRVQKLAQNIASAAGQANTSEAAGAHAFGEILKKKAKETKDAVAKSEALTEANAIGDNVDPVNMSLAVQEASYLVEFTSEVLQKMMKAYDDISKIGL